MSIDKESTTGHYRLSKKTMIHYRGDRNDRKLKLSDLKDTKHFELGSHKSLAFPTDKKRVEEVNHQSTRNDVKPNHQIKNSEQYSCILSKLNWPFKKNPVRRNLSKLDIKLEKDLAEEYEALKQKEDGLDEQSFDESEPSSTIDNPVGKYLIKNKTMIRKSDEKPDSQLQTTVVGFNFEFKCTLPNLGKYIGRKNTKTLCNRCSTCKKRKEPPRRSQFSARPTIIDDTAECSEYQRLSAVSYNNKAYMVSTKYDAFSKNNKITKFKGGNKRCQQKKNVQNFIKCTQNNLNAIKHKNLRKVHILEGINGYDDVKDMFDIKQFFSKPDNLQTLYKNVNYEDLTRIDIRNKNARNNVMNIMKVNNVSEFNIEDIKFSDKFDVAKLNGMFDAGKKSKFTAEILNSICQMANTDIRKGKTITIPQTTQSETDINITESNVDQVIGNAMKRNSDEIKPGKHEPKIIRFRKLPLLEKHDQTHYIRLMIEANIVYERLVDLDKKFEKFIVDVGINCNGRSSDVSSLSSVDKTPTFDVPSIPEEYKRNNYTIVRDKLNPNLRYIEPPTSAVYKTCKCDHNRKDCIKIDLNEFVDYNESCDSCIQTYKDLVGELQPEKLEKVNRTICRIIFDFIMYIFYNAFAVNSDNDPIDEYPMCEFHELHRPLPVMKNVSVCSHEL